MRILKTALTFGFAMAFTASAWAGTTVLYNSIPSPQPFALPSVSYQANRVAELGDEISFTGQYGALTTVTVGMSNYQGTRSTWMTDIGGTWTPDASYTNVTMNANGYYYPLTMTLYNVGAGGNVGSVLATETVNAFIPWRPEDAPGNPGLWQAPDGSYHYSSFSAVTFDFSSLDLTLPNQIIYGLSYNTESGGASPTGQNGPYDQLNFATSTAVTAGAEGAPGTVYLNDLYQYEYPTTGTAGTFTQTAANGGSDAVPDTGNYLAVTITAEAVPEPISMIFFGTGLSAVGGYMARRRMQKA